MDKPLSGLNVLIIDDDIFMAKLLTATLNGIGVSRVASAEHGIAALSLIKQPGHRYDVIICDLKMPKMDGIEFLRHLSQQDFDGNLILLSGHDSRVLRTAEQIAMAHRLNILGTLEKPVSAEQLKRTLLASPYHYASGGDTAAEPISAGELEAAIENRRIEAFFQPQIGMKDKRIVGFEALARWRHDTLGMISPDHFIPLAEDHQLIGELTDVVMEKALHAFKSLSPLTPAATLSINLSLDSLSNLALPDALLARITGTGIDPKRINLELTESRLMDNLTATLEILSRLKLNDIALSIDDFGTGYSTLNQLKQFPLDELKIDRGFVTGASQDEQLRIILESSVTLARKLKLKTVAEGIESQEDWELLAKLGVDVVQGYYICKPLPAEDMAEWIQQWNQPKTKAGASQAEAQTRAKPRRFIGKKILLVEDESFMRTVIVQSLLELGYQSVQTASSAEEALALLRYKTFDLIITDVEMGEISGLDMIERIRGGKTPHPSNVRIIVLTGKTDLSVLTEATGMNIQGFLAKPISYKVLNRKIEEAFSYLEGVQMGPQGAKTDNASPGTLGANISKQPEKIVKLSDLTSGMILKDNITARGSLLIKRGVKLNQVHLKALSDLHSVIDQHAALVELPKSS